MTTRGRPRDDTIDRRALEATRTLLVERGFEGTTIQAVADHAGLHVSALYRRWPSRVQMIEQATFSGLDPIDVQPTGDLRRDLRRFMRAYLAAFTTPAARAAAGGLLAQRRDRGASPLYGGVSARPQFRAILAAAGAGQVDPTVDPDDAFDQLLGAVLLRILLLNVAAPLRSVERSVEMLVRLLRPAVAGP